MIVVAGVWRSGTTWLSGALGEAHGLKVASEPLNLPWHRDHEGGLSDTYVEAVEACRPWASRLDPDPRGDDRRRVLDLFRLMRSEFSQPDVIKLMKHHHWRLLQQVWPGAKIVYLARRPRPWLESVLFHTYAGDTVAAACGDRWEGMVADSGYEGALLTAHQMLVAEDLRTLSNEAPNDHIVVRLEDLAADLTGTWRKLEWWLGLPPSVEVPISDVGGRNSVARTWPTSRGLTSEDLDDVVRRWAGLPV